MASKEVANSSELTGLDTFQAAPPCKVSTRVVPSLEKSPDSFIVQTDGLCSSSTIQRGALISSDTCELLPMSDLP